MSAKCVFAVECPIVSDFYCPPHDHSCTEIVFYINAQGKIKENGRSYLFNPNYFSIHQPGILHDSKNDVQGIHFCLGISGGNIDKNPAGTYECTGKVRELFLTIYTLIQTDPLYLSEELDIQCSLLALELKRKFQSTPEVNNPRVIDTVLQVKHWIDENFSNEISIHEIASSLFISSDYLRQQFRRSSSESPLQYLLKKRIEHATEMLDFTEKSVSEIAQACGFKNPYYFSRLFKKMTGFSPSSLRFSRQNRK